MQIEIRDFRDADVAAMDAIAAAAFAQYEHDFPDWPAFARKTASLAPLRGRGEPLVATVDGRVAGAVGYVGAAHNTSPLYDPGWPAVRMLAVAPQFRGLGLGRALTGECVARARRDRAAVLALHTSPFMHVALGMYLRMGFRFHRDAPPICGAPCAIYLLRLNTT